MATQLTVIYGSRKDLVTPETAQQTRAARYRVAGSVLVIVVSIVLAWVNPDAAKYCWLLLAVAPRPRRALVRPPRHLNTARPSRAGDLHAPASRSLRPPGPASPGTLPPPAQEPASGRNPGAPTGTSNNRAPKTLRARPMDSMCRRRVASICAYGRPLMPPTGAIHHAVCAAVFRPDDAGAIRRGRASGEAPRRSSFPRRRSR